MPLHGFNPLTDALSYHSHHRVKWLQKTQILSYRFNHANLVIRIQFCSKAMPKTACNVLLRNSTHSGNLPF